MTAMTRDPLRRERAIWFLCVNVMSFVIAVLIFAAVLYGDILSVVFEPLMRGIYAHKILVIAIAMSPLLASLLVGMAYAQRAIRRRKAEAAGAELSRSVGSASSASSA